MKIVIDIDKKDYEFIKSVRRIMKNSDTFQRIATDLFKAVREAEESEVERYAEELVGGKLWIMNECKNYIHRYKCDTYNENHNACKSCEMQAAKPIVFTIQPGYMHHNVKIITKDPRAEESKHYSTWVDGEGIAFLDLFDVMGNISADLNNKGYVVLFEVD